jgi:linoleate 10R-lipoxygenase
MKGSLTRLGIAEQYTFGRPSALPECKILTTFTGIKYACGDPTRFKVIYEKIGYGSILMFDEIAKYVLRALVHTNIPDVS